MFFPFKHDRTTPRSVSSSVGCSEAEISFPSTTYRHKGYPVQKILGVIVGKDELTIVDPQRNRHYKKSEITRSDFGVPSTFAEKIQWGTERLTRAMDAGSEYNCASFAHDLAGVAMNGSVWKDPTVDKWSFKDSETAAIPAYSTGRYARVDPNTAIRGHGHWFTMIQTGKNGTAVHVDGLRGPFILSQCEQIAGSYNGHRTYLASIREQAK